MSGKVISNFVKAFQTTGNVTAKLLKAFSVGNRVWPSRTSRNDSKHELRIDAGALEGERYRLFHLQVNSQVSNSGLKKWVRKNGTHANLATVKFDTLAEDPEAEAARVLDEMEELAKQNSSI
ncbi:hypothetical protein F5B18DRAFT_77381 [Nemania serpens]|nr:hypothetical protein F5B18DRAFT_77381 [Nemania serpens]